MEIVSKLRSIRHKAQYDWDTGGKTIAEDMQALAVAAMKEGMKTSDEGLNPEPDTEKLTAWEKYVRYITEDHDEFLRLTGRDQQFQQNPWAEKTLAYILGNGPCTDTSFADTTRYLKGNELKSLDAPKV